MGQRSARRMYRLIRGTLDLLYPKMRCVGAERIPAEPVVLVGNHCQAHGPLAGELRMPIPRKTWCAAEIMERESAADYAFRDFWSQNPKWTLPFYRLLSRAIVPLAVLIFNQAETIPVYRDSRVLSTFRQSVQTLEGGVSLLIFPEQDRRCNQILDDFQDRFIDLAKLYYRRTGKALAFVPIYVAPTLGETHYGEPTRFNPDAPLDEERARIKRYLMDSITALAESLPEHTVIPYRNIRKRDYPKNKTEVPSQHETACR